MLLAGDAPAGSFPFWAGMEISGEGVTDRKEGRSLGEDNKRKSDGTKKDGEPKQ